LARRLPRPDERDEGQDGKCCADECFHVFFTLRSILG
jgi:hypothetical protein